jgi:HEAT repeat protein
MHTYVSRNVIPGLAVLLLACSTGCEQTRGLRERMRGDTPGRYARLMEDDRSPENRRLGINGLARHEFGQREPYTTRYRQIFQSDPEPLVRATALRALNRSRDAGAVDLYMKALADADAVVRLEGAKALFNMPDPAATDALLRVLNDVEESKDVRIAAAAALRHYPRLDVARALVAVLPERDFGVAWEARRSLKRITGVDYAYDDAAWLTYISNPDQPLS